MALVRILVDGYSLLHNWPELAPGEPRHSEAARDALIRHLTHYQDASGTPVTVFFDGAGRRGPARPPDTSHSVEVLFSRNGKTADAMIERATHRFAAWGEVLAVTDDYAERDTVTAMGGFASSCRDFVRQVNDTLGEQAEDIHHHNRRERNRYHRRR
jgi:predicted RNA-binding protein with PIN domain